MKGLFLDDERSPADVTWITYPSNIEWEVVRTFYDFCISIETCDYDIISFDHDIQDFWKIKKGELAGHSVYGDYYHQEDSQGEYTGKDAAKYLVELYNFNLVPKEKPKYLLVHSKNPIGKRNIENTLKGL
jgi:hypothetical protein